MRCFEKRLIPTLSWKDLGRGVLFLLFFLGISVAAAQEVPKIGVAIFNLVPKPLTIRIAVDTNCLFQATGGEDAMGLGGFTGVLPWKPETGTLTIEAKGYPVITKKPFAKKGEVPLLVLKQVATGTLDVLVVPNAKVRTPVFYDAINLSDQASIKIQANQKDFDLPQAERVRLSTEKTLKYSIGKTSFEPITPDENGNFLLIFFTDTDKAIRCIVTRDDLL